MAELLILEFTDVDEAQYDAVNEKLGIDARTGKGDWPKGLQMHSAGRNPDGAFVVTEVWSSQQAQADFMQTRLGEALAAGGVTSVPTVTWIPLINYQTPNA